MESARLARAARDPAGDSVRACAAVCGADLPAGRAESDAGVAPGRARAARQTGLRTNLRVGDGCSLWWSGLVHDSPVSRLNDESRGSPGGSDARSRGIRQVAPVFGRSQRADRRSRQRPSRLPTPDGGRQTRRGWTEARRVEARAGQAERASKIVAGLYVCASCVGNFRIPASSPVVIKQKYDLLAQAVEAVASSQIRNQGTIGGAVSQDARAAINPFCS
ncbi:hypothetical protein SBA1_580004 [Candidatus Sulfotelmatobacter kueseliae]|uniref:Molybdopterin dehydrogenase FAD-binding domain-containing protein n=1 Tax=Candidatus Sulfotelmatobacter kueseliae TaxID=2042962 RepID=A0A2U3L0D3_9BACT|nr:hypothetical protein SBA1_580004 [Candidatus Sulfotelmatobacter kueseliae]